MAIDIIVPRLGWSMEEGTFCRWLKQDGDLVREGDSLFELEGDKATQAVESFDAGILHIAEKGPKPGDAVKVGQVLGTLLSKNESAPSGANASDHPARTISEITSGINRATTSTPTTDAAESRAATNVFRPRPTRAPDQLQASPSIRRLARQRGLELETAVLTSSYLRVPAQLPDNRQLSPGALQSVARSQGGRQKLRISPRAARLATQLGVTVENIAGTGRNGRIRERDVEAASANASMATGNVAATSEKDARDHIGTTVALSPLRRTIAERMMLAAHQAAPVTLTSQTDVSELVEFRNDFKRTQVERGRPSPSFTAMFVKLAAAALTKHPELLQQWAIDKLIAPEGLHISVAVHTSQGLMTPVIRDVATRSLLDVSQELAALAELARARKLTLPQMQGGVFTVSSLGGYRVDAFTPILNSPQTAVLGVGRIGDTPVVRQGALAVSQTVTLSLTFDHRVVDGAPAASFLTNLCEIMERPMPWLLT
jgi:pyruvate dehydrogenase E2 component (dihydrolipoamide acetyltransferase)